MFEKAKWASSVAFLLTLLALLPLGGAVWFAKHSVDGIADSEDRAAMVERSVEDLVEITTFRADLLDERNWILVVAGLEAEGVSAELATEVTGIDIVGELALATARVDTSLQVVGDPSVDERLTQTRQAELGSSSASDPYLDLELELAADGDALLRDLIRSAGSVDGSQDLTDALHQLESATEARRAVTLQLTTYFATLFADPDGPQGALGLLMEYHVLHHYAMDTVELQSIPGSAVSSAIGDLDRSPAVAEFSVAIDTIISSRLSTGPDADRSSLEALLVDIDQIVAIFRAGAESSEAHSELVVAASIDVEKATVAFTDVGQAERSSATTTIIIFIAASLALVFVVSTFIVIPLRQLANQARHIGQSGERATSRLRGPSEVRAVAKAIDEAAENLALAERQAQALAVGELSHPSLTEHAPGTLGTSLQRAVKTLTTSLSEREELRERLSHEASHDSLSGLPNRKAILNKMEAALAEATETDANVVVIYIDLDGLKQINDESGHLSGDHAIRVAAERIRGALGEGMHVGRVGGDEFLVVSPAGTLAATTEIGKQVCEALKGPFEYSGTSFIVGASCGVAEADGREITSDELLYEADMACYRAKELGRGRIEVCDQEMRDIIRAEEVLEAALRMALENDEFILHYQPTFDSRTHKIAGVEALIRWQRPGHGLVNPGDFIEFAERKNLIVEIDRWVMSEAARQLVAWTDDVDLASVPIAVNISARHFATGHVAADVLNPLLEHGVDPKRLVVEVTESAVLLDLEHAASRLQSLREIGVKVAIDDFGTGYTSLAYLRTLPFDILKIDRSFVSDPTAVEFVRLIVKAGHLIGVTVTAEGVETAEQADFLSALGCDVLQGFYLARPCAIDALKSSSLLATQ